jgi:hypothetical protein
VRAARGAFAAGLLLCAAACGDDEPAVDAATDAPLRDGETSDGAGLDGAMPDGEAPTDGPASDAPPTDATIPERCLPQAVGGEGGCSDLVGITWNGSVCIELYGCGCTGVDCPGIYGTFTECWADRRGCAGLCAPQRVMPVGTECDLSWGPYWLGSAGCESFIACDCTGEDCDRPYPDKPTCEHAHRGCTGRCEAQVATGMGACALELGVFWDGGDCVSVSGCSCDGDDCDDGYVSIEECMYAHRGCPP